MSTISLLHQIRPCVIPFIWRGSEKSMAITNHCNYLPQGHLDRPLFSVCSANCETVWPLWALTIWYKLTGTSCFCGKWTGWFLANKAMRNVGLLGTPTHAHVYITGHQNFILYFDHINIRNGTKLLFFCLVLVVPSSLRALYFHTIHAIKAVHQI